MVRRIVLMATAAMALAGCAVAHDQPVTANGGGAANATASVERIDCGTIDIADLSVFSSAGHYKGESKTLVDSCYLIRHGDTLMLWDTGLPEALAADGPREQYGMTMRLRTTIADQLAAVGVSPADIDLVGISHFHDDHTGQLARFPQARLLTGQGDWDWIREEKKGLNARPYDHWAKGDGTVTPITQDTDVFGDGSVTVLNLPGHTPGHTALRVRTADGYVMLTGDVAHFHANYDNNEIPTFNDIPDASLASLARFKDMARDYSATVVIQHDPADVGLVKPLGQ